MGKKAKKLTPIMVRVPEELHQRIKKSAEGLDRSLNAEIVSRLESSFRAPNYNLLSAILRSALGGQEVRYEPPVHREKSFSISPEIKQLIVERIGAFIESIPVKQPDRSLTDEEFDSLSKLIDRHPSSKSKRSK